MTIVADDGDLRIRPGSRLTRELPDRLRAHKPELLHLLTWPEECLTAERKFGHPYDRLFPLVGKTVRTPAGCGRVIGPLRERAMAIVRGRFAAFLPGEVSPTRSE